ncbi:ribosome maturation factor RimM [Candidatus Oleimmundimicrobium sp.]|uniref:ribosome maturation factor RimM n=1 Tax=Candidatus Oleimmundimicrobium sp. TaxID=3060597 RepID=UPI002716D0D2|nr:ribosome maturation factor RimM [Candidatus Oleimmundimicrobium sp.]MDO8885364.1 ribosome maturation factor RimM [Candidatus Oleimmundimicrobium sp.]
MKPTFLTIGKIVGAHGLRGEVKILSLTDFPARFKAGLSVYIYPPSPEIDKLKIEWTKGTSKNIILKFNGVDNRKDAEKLKGLLLQVLEENACSLPKGTYWQHEIIGLKVITLNKKFIGYITEIIKTGSNDVYVVKFKGKEKFIPAIKDVVKEIDLKNKRMVIEPLEGLLE